MRTRVVLIQGMQFGSEGKGQIAGLVGYGWKPLAAVCANHPNAGHTFRDPLGRKFIHRILPVGAAVPSVESILIGPGAVIDVDALITELEILASAGLLDNKSLIIHPRAATLLPQHTDEEAKLVTIGSTMKGSMEATIHKMRRQTNTANIAEGTSFIWKTRINKLLPTYVDSELYDDTIRHTSRLMVEGSQGFSLGLHEEFYPYCTSRDVSTAQVLADCRIPVDTTRMHIIGVVRSYPIRVANRFNAEGIQVGTSGPFYNDQRELDWVKDLNREPELTTVTRLPRRVFSFSNRQVAQAAEVIRPNTIALTFCDYLTPEAPEEGAGPVRMLPTEVREFALRIEHQLPTDTWVRLFSFGPKFDDSYEAVGFAQTHAPGMGWIG